MQPTGAHRRESNDDRYIIAGYPWFKCRARDTFISLPGLTLSIEEDDYFELVMKTAIKGYYEFMEGKPVTVHIAEIDQPDVPLWAVWALQQYAKEKGAACLKKYCSKFIKDGSDVREVQSSPQPEADAQRTSLHRRQGQGCDMDELHCQRASCCSPYGIHRRV